MSAELTGIAPKGVALADLVAYCDDTLTSASIRDYCPNGLQVQGSAEVRCIVSGVTASQALIDAAVAQGADLLLVHHGYFWKGEAEPITGIKYQRIKTLIKNDISLLAYHLPLDVHPELGNNAQLAKRLGLLDSKPMEPFAKPAVGDYGRLPSKMTAAALRDKLTEVLGRECLHIGDPEAEIESLAWCSGAAQSMIDKAIALGVDAYISGEISEPTVHMARESGVHYFSAGHHATERYGVQALGEHLAERFGIAHHFIDIDNPV